MPEQGATFIDAVRKSVTVPASPDRSFELFTARFSEWWPLATHSVGIDNSAGVSFGAGVGGIILETLVDGTTSVWGTVTRWDPPDRVTFSWHAGTPEAEAGLVESLSRPAGQAARSSSRFTLAGITGRMAPARERATRPAGTR
jgi:uncharacterized protein YndB with AHSA1/START domain